ncbi:amidohydrolase family protein [Gulosibacter sediminis]|uniref:amidohydrolase family protein n=1 Tax=Gulosibacter sediminis TaxID=1729695 RepID=UPI002E2C5753|nr:amidohydrolase family protein [Gulosibacter sediminis]
MTQPVFDAHLHIVDPAHPLVENNGFMPGPFMVADYQRRIEGLGIAGGAVVSGSFQAFDQGYLIDALAALGPTYVGVTQIPSDTSDERIRELNAAGVRAVRFNVARGGSADLDELELLARRVYDLAGWHAELYIDARTIDDELSRRIASLPAASIDHLGMHGDGLANLLRLVEQGVKVKATGFGRVELDPRRSRQSCRSTRPPSWSAPICPRPARAARSRTATSTRSRMHSHPSSSTPCFGATRRCSIWAADRLTH